MSITQQGIAGEQRARDFLYKHVKPESIQQLDWIYKKNGVWYALEVKNKERFKPPPFYGHGLNMSQVKRRMEIYKDIGLRCVLLVFEPGGDEVFYQWLDVLESGRYFDTKNGVRVYPIEAFAKRKAE